MAIRSGFFNSVNGDRIYDAKRFAEYFSSFIGNGIFPNPSDCLQVISNNDMTITVRPGKAWINGYILINDDDYILEIEPADGVLNRIDRIVARYDVVDREIRLEVKKGTFASEPTAPDLQRDADAYELALADIYISAGATSITQANITDLRLSTELCGIVHGTVEQVDTTTLFNQYVDWYTTTTGQAETDIEAIKQQFQAEFDAWFAGIKNILDESTAGNLLNLIEEHKNDTNNPHNVTPQQIGAVSQEDFELHKNDKVTHIDYAVASGTNAYTANIQGITELVEGLSVKIKFQNANTGAATLNINCLGIKEIRKSNGNALSSGNIKAGQILHLVYTGSVFQLLGEGGEYGTATADKVLTGYTIGTENGIVSGTMPNNGAKIITPSTTNQAIPAGYHNGSGYVKGDANLKAENIKSGVSIFGVTGTCGSLVNYMTVDEFFLDPDTSYTIRDIPFIPKIVIFEVVEHAYALGSSEYYEGDSYHIAGIFKDITLDSVYSNGFYTDIGPEARWYFNTPTWGSSFVTFSYTISKKASSFNYLDYVIFSKTHIFG